MRTRFLLSGVLLCFAGAAVVLYQLSESCEDNVLAGAYQGYPWCTDILSHINLTFVGVLAVIVGVVVLALGGPLRWIGSGSEGAPASPSPD